MVVRIEEEDGPDDTGALVTLVTWLVTFVLAAAIIVVGLIFR